MILYDRGGSWPSFFLQSDVRDNCERETQQDQDLPNGLGSTILRGSEHHSRLVILQRWFLHTEYLRVADLRLTPQASQSFRDGSLTWAGAFTHTCAISADPQDRKSPVVPEGQVGWMGEVSGHGLHLLLLHTCLVISRVVPAASMP